MKNYSHKVEYTCEICGGTFMAWSTYKTKTCSPKCTKAMMRQRLIVLYSEKAGEPIEQYLRREYLDNLRSYREIMAALGLTQVHTLKKLFKMFDIPIRKGSEAVKVQWIDNPERREQTRNDLLKRWSIPAKISEQEKRLHQQARKAVRYAIRKGILPLASTLVCVRCGAVAEEYHHASYEKEHWLDVEAFCNKCHWAVHHT